MLESDVLIVQDVDLLDLVHDAEDFPDSLHVSGFYLLNLIAEAQQLLGVQPPSRLLVDYFLLLCLFFLWWRRLRLRCRSRFASSLGTTFASFLTLRRCHLLHQGSLHLRGCLRLLRLRLLLRDPLFLGSCLASCTIS